MVHALAKQTGLTLRARFVAFLAILFVSAQFLGVAHSAAYGEADHGHDGQPCIVASIVKKSSDLDIAAAPLLDPAVHSIWQEPLADKAAPASPATSTRPIRAPPAHA